MIFDLAQPQMVRGRVMVPLRGVFEKIGATIEWFPAKNLVKATRGGTTIECWIGKKFAAVDGDQTPLDVPAMILSGRTLVPLRFFSEALGARVSWNAGTWTVGLDIN
ncbi:MAG: copper amine oxidase N-terminal domain-containing protein [Fimbriimonadaceae bacterium]